jgi:hypothetical protein
MESLEMEMGVIPYRKSFLNTFGKFNSPESKQVLTSYNRGYQHKSPEMGFCYFIRDKGFLLANALPSYPAYFK